MISWITIVILSAPRRSTRGRAPWFSAIIRFWIKVDSLNRPPTLLTISSSFNSSSIERSTSTPLGLQHGDKLFDTTVEVIVDHLDIIPVGLGELGAGQLEAADDGGPGVGPPAPQAG